MTIMPMDSIDVSWAYGHDVSALAHDNNVWFLTLMNSPAIILADTLFQERSRYERHGNGPAELLNARDIAFSNSFIWVTDFTGLAIHQFSKNLEYKQRIPLAFRPFSIRSISDSVLWVGTMDMIYEDLYTLTISSDQFDIRRTQTRLVNTAPESIVLQSSYMDYGIIYRPFTNKVSVYKGTVHVVDFANPLRPARVTYENTLAGPMPEEKIHQTAFVTATSICLLTGKPTKKHQPVACFTHEGRPYTTFVLTPPMSIASVKENTLYTYSPHTHHVYRYLLDF